MATNTTNYQLKKPATTDYVTIGDINANMDKIDTQMKVNADAIAGKAGTSVATQSANGLMSSSDKTKLDGVDSALAGKVSKSGDTMTGTLWTPSIVAKSSKQVTPFIDFHYNNGDPFATRLIQLDGDFRIANSGVVTLAKGPSDASDNSTKVATTAWVNTASLVVHTNGNETIDGYKSFTKSPITTAWTGYHITMSSMTKGNPENSSNINLWTGFFDKNDTGTNQPGNLMAGLRFTVPVGNANAPPNTFIELSNQYYRDTYLRLYDNGTTAYATCPNPPSGATSNEIATANWSLSKFLKKTGDTMTGELLANGGVRSDFIRKLQSDGQNVGFVLFEETETSNIASLNARKSTGTNTAVYPYLKLFANSDGTYYATLSSNYIGQNDNSDKILTIKMANSLPSLVHTTGNENVAGAKTFTSRIVEQKSSDMGIEMLSTSFDRSATSTSYQRPVQFIARDKNGESVMLLQTYAESNNRRGLDLMLYDMGGNHCELSLKSDGSKRYASAPTTPSDATSNEIATANWALNKFQRKITYGTGDPPSGGEDGDIYIQI